MLHVIPVLWALKQEDRGTQAILAFAMRLCFRTTAKTSRDNQETGSFTYVKLEHLQAQQSRPTGTQTQPFPSSKCSLTSDLISSTWSPMDQKHLNGTLWMPLGCWDSCTYFYGKWQHWMFCQSELLTIRSFWKAVRGEWFSLSLSEDRRKQGMGAALPPPFSAEASLHGEFTTTDWV